MSDNFQFNAVLKKAVLELMSSDTHYFKKSTANDYVSFGSDNMLPNRLIKLFNEHPEHRAIINRKARYMFGQGVLNTNPEQETAFKMFNETFNSFENLDKQVKKIAYNLEIFNTCYVQVTSNVLGTPLEYTVLNGAMCRLSECGNKLFYCKEWKQGYTPKQKISTFKRFTKDSGMGTSFLELKFHNPSATAIDSVYSLPTYYSAIDELYSDMAISIFNKNYIENGFSVGTIINFFNGEPLPEEKNKLVNKFKGTYSGVEGENVMITFNDRDAKEPTLLQVGIDDIDKKYEATSRRTLQKIFVAHEAMPELFNIKFDNSVFSAGADLAQLQTLFINSYVKPRQQEALDFLEYLSYLKTGAYIEMRVDDLDLVSLTQKPTTTALDAGEVNDTLTNLTGRQFQGLMRIVSKFDNGKINKESAIALMVSGFGLSKDEAMTFLIENDSEQNNDLQMSALVDKALLHFEKTAIQDNEDEVVEVRLAKIHNSTDALKLEREVMKFASELVIKVEELDNAVLMALRGNPTLTIEELSLQLNQNVLTVSESVSRLISKKLIIDTISGFTVSEKGVNKEVDSSDTYEIYTVYKYAVNNDKPKLSKGGTSRPFCKKMMSLSVNKSWEFESIDSLTNDLGTNAWDYKGGYYTNPETGIVDADCRHTWNAVIKRRKVKK